MTLSNFDWTDKDSVKWFILLPTGHEGPYSLNTLSQMADRKKLAPDVKVWAEGLPDGMPLRKVLEHAKTQVQVPDVPAVPVAEELPPLPDDDIPPLPLEEVMVEERIEKKPFVFPAWAFFVVVLTIMGIFTFGSVIKEYEKFEIRRLPKMTLNLHERILKENAFDGWNKKIFFKEYLPDDHSHIWLVTTGYQNCEVEASFNSLQGKLLSMSDEKVSFKSSGKLKNHIAELSKFDFTAGNKIIPGMYEMDIKASGCEWDGVIPAVMNRFQSPDTEYVARMKVVLFSKGAEEFTKILDRLVKKKMEITLKEQNQNELFWQDLQQKLETLQAITLQIEQHFLDFIDEGPGTFNKNRKPMIDKYTRQFGSFLTSFVVENENYFKNINPEAKGSSQKRNYELMVRLTTKQIGLESMKFIEEFQALKKKPSVKELGTYSERVKKVFSNLKTNINEKIIQVSEDRSK